MYTWLIHNHYVCHGGIIQGIATLVVAALACDKPWLGNWVDDGFPMCQSLSCSTVFHAQQCSVLSGYVRIKVLWLVTIPHPD